MPHYVLGLDIGGSGAKAGLFGDDGKSVGSGHVEYAMTSTLPGQAEQDAETWWHAAVLAIRQAINGIDPRHIAGVGVSCTNGLVAVDKQGQSLRPAIMLWDQRALAEVDDIRRVLDPESVFRITGNPIAPGAFSLPTILWLKRHEPETFAAAHKFLVPGGYLVGRLTGAFTIDYSRACTTLLFDIRRHAWHVPFAQALEIPFEKLPIPMPSDHVAGGITADAAEATGLVAGTPVLEGCMDTVAASIGSGAIEAGDCFVIMGTAARVCTPLSAPVFDARFMNSAHVIANRWLAIGALNGIGSSWRWIRDTFGHVERTTADLTGQNVYDLLTAEAAMAPPGSKGLIFLPYMAGERTPIWNPFARGVFLGVTLGHTRNDVLRSVLEGTAFAIRHVVEILEATSGTTLRRLRIGGTAAASGVWNQIIADVLGKTVETLAEPQTEVLGAAILAGVSLGVYPSYCTAIERAVVPARRYHPDRRAHQVYSELFPVYRDLYADIEPYFERLARLDLTSGWVTRGDSDDSRGHQDAAHRLCATGLPPPTRERTRG